MSCSIHKMEYYSSIQKEHTAAMWINLKDIMLRERSQTPIESRLCDPVILNLKTNESGVKELEVFGMGK